MVQAYGREEQMAREFDGINVQFRDANKRAIFFEAVLDAAIEMVSTLCVASVLWGRRAKLGSRPISFAMVVTFTQYLRRFFEPVSMLTQRLHRAAERTVGAERFSSFWMKPMWNKSWRRNPARRQWPMKGLRSTGYTLVTSPTYRCCGM